MSAAYVAVLWSILDRMNDAGECWPSLSRIAEDAGVDRRTASRAIEALSSSGLLRVQSGSRTSTNVYRLGTGESANKCAGDSAHTCTGESAPTGESATSGEMIHLGRGESVQKVGANLPDKPTTKNLLKENQEKAREKQASKRPVVIESDHLPDWMPRELWQEWKQHRGRKLTPVAEKNAFRKLDALRTQGHCPAKVIRRSLENGWAGLFADERGTETRADGATPAIKAVGVIQRDPRTEREIIKANRAEMARFGMELPPEDFAE